MTVLAAYRAVRRLGSIGSALFFLQLLMLPSLAQDRAPGAGPQRRTMSLGVSATGLVKTIDVADGAHVAAGQLLLEIDCAPLEQEIKTRVAALAAAQAAFERARNGSRPEQIASGRAEVGVSKARADEAQDQYDRFARLTVGTAITAQQLFQAQREARVAAAELDDSEKKLALLQAGSRIEDIDEAQSLRDEAQGRLDEAKAELGQCSVHAPTAGAVRLNANVGQFVSTAVPTTLISLTPDAR